MRPKKKLSYEEALEEVKTGLSINAERFASAVLNATENKTEYVKVRDLLAKKIVDNLGF